ncbi:ABC-three component system middle component 6 [Paenibacillus gorillae]|uniref:ABC-three component system middle component 6 n=1 Tax=Paenibacillus gorillae TaxID=1243662 RepID=UPI001EE1BC80|nr:ABC-three component system middle component 6 [Paenibacillus gorillae]
MLLPDNIHPTLSIYYNGSVVLKELKLTAKQQVFELYQEVKDKNDMSFSTFLLSLDWLYLIDVATVNEDGWVELCSSKKLIILNQEDIIRELNFHSGMNLIIDETPTSDGKQTGNNVGKTTVLKLIDFCLGASPAIIYTDTENKK